MLEACFDPHMMQAAKKLFLFKKAGFARAGYKNHKAYNGLAY
jgi:hypothetical protein